MTRATAECFFSPRSEVLVDTLILDHPTGLIVLAIVPRFQLNPGIRGCAIRTDTLQPVRRRCRFGI